MKNVRLPEKAQITMGRDEYRRSQGLGAYGWWVLVGVVALLWLNGQITEGESSDRPAPRPSSSQTR